MFVSPESSPGRNFYPRPPRGGRRGEFCRAGKSYGISIHALREEGDIEPEAGEKKQEISIHALRVEGDQAASPEAIQPKEFLSTPSARRATAAAVALAFARAISIHALREEGDPSKPFFTS